MANPTLIQLLGKVIQKTAAGISSIFAWSSLDVADASTKSATELAVAGDFSTTTGWAATNCTLAVASSKGTATETGAAATTSRIAQSITVEVGKRYQATVTFHGALSTLTRASLRVGTTAGGLEYGEVFATNNAIDNVLTLDFVPTGTTATFSLYAVSTNTVVGVAVWSAFSVKEIIGGTFRSHGTNYLWGNTYLGGIINSVKVAPGGELTLEGSATVWNDIQFSIASGKVPAANYPTWETFTTNTSEYSFTVNDYIDLEANEAAHWWKEGTAGNMHLHLAIKTANTSGADRFAKFTVYVATSGGATWAELTPLSAEVTIPNGAAALTKYYLDMGDITLTGFTIGTQIKARLKRVAATGGTEYPANIFVTQVGCHLEQDTLGSKTEAAK